MKALMKRNVKLFFRDRTAALFSLLSVFLILALYAIFLGDAWLGGTANSGPEAKALLHTWLVAGILSVVSVTTSLGAFSVMIEDKVRKKDKDFYSAPIKRSQIAGGYMGSAFAVGMILSLLTLFITGIYLSLKGEIPVSLILLVKLLLLELLTVLVNTSMICFLVSFLKSHSAFSTVSTVIGTLIGFLTGIYLPTGALPQWVQIAVKVFPVSHAASLFRQVLMEDSMQRAFAGLPKSGLDQFKEYTGVVFRFGNHTVSSWMSVSILILTAAVCYGLSFWKLSRRSSN